MCIYSEANDLYNLTQARKEPELANRIPLEAAGKCPDQPGMIHYEGELLAPTVDDHASTIMQTARCRGSGNSKYSSIEVAKH